MGVKVVGRWVIGLPQLARLNELMGSWRKAARLKKRDRRAVSLACQAARVPKAEGKRRVSIHVVLAPRQRAGDPDCWFKSCLDALVHALALKDDNRQWCELGPVTHERGEAAGMVVILEDCDEAA